MTTPRGVRADLAPDPTDVPSAPPSGIGDPDFPDGTGHAPKPGAVRGVHRQGPRDTRYVSKDRMGNWVWNFRTVFAVGLRFYFRF